MIEWESAAWIWVSGLFFAVIHSILASRFCKQWCYNHGLREPRYRLTYTLQSILMTAILVFYVNQLPDTPLYQTDGLIRIVLVSAQVLGLACVFAAFQPIDGFVFLGLRKTKNDNDPLIESGIYRWIRHPMYSGVMLILLAMPEQTWNGLHFALVICVYLIIGSRLEEARMLITHPHYASYRHRIPAFFPFPYL